MGKKCFRAAFPERSMQISRQRNKSTGSKEETSTRDKELMLIIWRAEPSLETSPRSREPLAVFRSSFKWSQIGLRKIIIMQTIFLHLSERALCVSVKTVEILCCNYSRGDTSV